MRVIAKSSLVKFWSRPDCADAQGALQSWYDEAIKATWKTLQDIKDQYDSASICGNNRVAFNIAGNKYRLVVEMQYRAGIAWVKFIGPHARYDKIDVEVLNRKRRLSLRMVKRLHDGLHIPYESLLAAA